MKKTLTSLLLTVLFACFGSAETWYFSTPDNPAISDAGTPALILPGEVSTGWWSEPLAGTSTTGFWDLGLSGLIWIEIPVSTRTSQITVSTVEWIDGMNYFDFSLPEIPGFSITNVSESLVESSPIFFGGWYRRDVVFSGTPSSTTPALTLHGQLDGSLLNSVTITVQQVQQPTKSNRKKK